MTEKVEGDPFPGQDGTGRTVDQGDVARHRVMPVTFDDRVVDVRDSDLAEDLVDHFESVYDPRRLEDDVRLGFEIRWHGRVRGHVAGSDVLGEGAGDQLRCSLRQVAHAGSLCCL